MKKLMCGLSIILTSLLVSCNMGMKEDILLEKTKELSVEIEADKERFSDYSYPSITFTPKLEGETDKEIEYHWIIENEIAEDIEFYVEQFIKEEGGGDIDIINSGDPVELGVFAFVSYVENAVSEFSIILKIEEKGTDNILAEDKLVIVNRAGDYEVIR